MIAFFELGISKRVGLYHLVESNITTRDGLCTNPLIKIGIHPAAELLTLAMI